MKPDNKSQKRPAPLSQQARIDGRCDQFESRLKAGERPRIEEFLGGAAGPERQALLRELLRLEIEYRGRQGQAFRREEYIGRFPADETLIQGICDETRPPAAVPIASNAGKVPLVPGSRPLPEYELIRRLGKGGFGEVWHAAGPGGMDVALKFIRLDKGGEVEERALEAMKRIRHPNLVSVFGAWHRNNLLILAMELCDRSLSDRLKETLAQKQPGIPLKELLNYMRDTANALDALNEQDVQHRDVKPANLLLLHKGVKVADFGLAKVLEATVGSHTGPCTPAYATPECFRGQIAKQSDQYSLAMTYYHLRTGRMLFDGNLARLMQCHLHEQPTFAGLLAPEQAVVARALAKEPAQRWPSCLAFVDELMRTNSATPQTASSAPKPEPPTETYRADKRSTKQRALPNRPTVQPVAVPEAPEAARPDRTLILEPTIRVTAVKSRGLLWIGIGVVLTIPLLLAGVCAFGFSRLLPNLFPAISIKADTAGPPSGTGPKMTIGPDKSVPPVPPAAAKVGFVPLFNGKDLTGWRKEGKGTWKVDFDGTLVGQGPDAVLVTKLDDYKECKVYVELSASEDADAYVLLRMSRDFKSNWQGMSTRVFGKGGTVHAGMAQAAFIGYENGMKRLEFKPGEKFTLEAWTEGDVIWVSTNGELTAGVGLQPGRFSTGGIGVIVVRGSVQIRRFEVKEVGRAR